MEGRQLPCSIRLDGKTGMTRRGSRGCQVFDIPGGGFRQIPIRGDLAGRRFTSSYRSNEIAGKLRDASQNMHLGLRQIVFLPGFYDY